MATASQAERAARLRAQRVSFNLGGGLLGMLTKVALNTRSREQRITVHAVATGEELYVIGHVKKRGDGEIEIARGGDGAERFFISTRSEDQLTASYGRQAMVCYGIGGVLALAGLAIAAQGATR